VSSAEAFGTQGVNIRAVKPKSPRPRAVDLDRMIEVPARVDPPISTGPLPEPDAVYDAGALGCGDGPLTIIAARLRAMPAGSVLEIRATDLGVIADLPAWCRMVGHTFLGGGSGEYAGRFLVRRKDG
jgi:tRNA 2-thiouridine synthesizing protein A